jgi:hypothetical protein
MRSTARTIALAVTALLATTTLAACGKSTPSAISTTTTTAPPTTTTAAPTTTEPTTTTAPTTTTTAAKTTCQTTQLHIVAAGRSGAAGTQEVTFSLTNTSSTLCTMYGYPGMLLLNAAGEALPTTVDRGGGLAFENVPAAQVSLAPGQVAYFNLGYSDVTNINPACSTATQVEITPPTDTTYLTVPASPGIMACNNGMLHVSAVFGATDTAGTQTTAPHAG